jgi:hypothetical protein
MFQLYKTTQGEPYMCLGGTAVAVLGDVAGLVPNGFLY